MKKLTPKEPFKIKRNINLTKSADAAIVRLSKESGTTYPVAMRYLIDVGLDAQKQAA